MVNSVGFIFRSPQNKASNFTRAELPVLLKVPIDFSIGIIGWERCRIYCMDMILIVVFG